MPIIDPALTFDFTTDQFPLRAGNTDVAFTITATNNTTKAVDLQGFYISFPIGLPAGCLTNNSSKIVADTPEGIDTPVKSEAEGQLKYTYDTTFTLRPGKALVFKFHKVDINSTPGTSNVIITEIHTESDMRVRKQPVTKFPKGWGKVTFTVEKPIIPFGGDAAVGWDGPEGATYTLEYYSYKDRRIIKVPAINEPALANRGRYPSFGGALKLNKSTDFVLNVELVVDGETYRAQEQKTVTVEPPPLPDIKSFTASKTIIEGETPEKVTFKWVVENAAVVEISGDYIGTNTVTDRASFEMTTNKSGTYQLKAISEDHSYRQTSIPIQTYLDFLTFNKFRLSNDVYSDPGDFDGALIRNTLDENMSFLTRGIGSYTFLAVTYIKRQGDRFYRESNRQSEVIEFTWKILNEKVEVELKAGKHMPKERIKLVIVSNRLRYETAPSIGSRQNLAFTSQRLEKVNVALPFDMDQADMNIDTDPEQENKQAD
jgi:hypothetical protein